MSESEAADEAVVLRYRGNGYLVGVPARDLTVGDVATIVGTPRFAGTGPGVLKQLTSTGLYAKPSAPKKAARKSAAPAADRKAK